MWSTVDTVVAPDYPDHEEQHPFIFCVVVVVLVFWLMIIIIG